METAVASENLTFTVTQSRIRQRLGSRTLIYQASPNQCRLGDVFPLPSQPPPFPNLSSPLYLNAKQYYNQIKTTLKNTSTRIERFPQTPYTK